MPVRSSTWPSAVSRRDGYRDGPRRAVTDGHCHPGDRRDGRRLHRDGDPRGRGGVLAVVGPVGEDVLAVEAGVRHVGEGAVRCHGDLAVGGLDDVRRGQDVAVRVGVVGQDAGRRDGERLPTHGVVRVVAGDRCDVDRLLALLHRDGHRRRGGGRRPVAGPVGEGVRAGEAGGGGVGEPTRRQPGPPSPLAGWVTPVAVSASPSASVSLARTPGAATTSGSSSPSP